MNKDRFDFLEIDVAIPAAEKMQQEDRTAVVLENNCKVVGILNEKVEKLENRLAEALSAPDETVSSFHKASRVTVGEDSRRVLEQEGDAICRKTTEMIGKEGKKLMDRLSMRDRTIVSTVVFWCMVETVVFSFGDFHLHLYGQRTVHPQHHAVENARLCGRISPALHWADSFCLP